MPEKHTHRAAFVFHEDCPRCQERLQEGLIEPKRADTVLPPKPLQEAVASLVEAVGHLTDRLEELEREVLELKVRTNPILDVTELNAWRQTVDADRAGIRRKLQTHEVQVHGRQNA